MQDNAVALLPEAPQGPLDWHAHVFLRSLKMTRQRRYTPQADAPVSLLRAELRRNGMAGALLVQPSFLGTDNSFLLSALKTARKQEGEPMFWGVVAVAPETPASALAAMKAAGVVGARLNLFSSPTPNLQAPVWRRFFENLNRLDWHLELHIEGPRLPVALPPLLEHCDKIVVDHFGLPSPTQPQLCDGLRGLLDAPKSRLWVKASAPYRVFEGLAAREAAARCAPIYGLLAEALGEERLLWGSDWPWTRFASVGDYATTRRWLEDWRRPSSRVS